MHIFVRMTIHFLVHWFSSCTFLYEWQSIFFLYGFSSCTFLYKWLSIFLSVFVMLIFLRMTNNLSICFRHAHLCTNDYPYYYGFSSCTSLYKWLSILFLHGFSLCTFLYEWYPYSYRFFVMYIFVWMTILFRLCFQCVLFNGNSEFLCVFSSNVLVLPCA